jgi:hypothetical protein
MRCSALSPFQWAEGAVHGAIGWQLVLCIPIPLMGMFAKTANVDFRLLFANQRKQTSVFCLQKTKESLSFLFSICSKQMEVAIFR